MILLLWLACAAPQPPPAPDVAAPAEPAATPEPEPEASFEYEGWPGEGIPVITAAQPFEADLFDTPGGAPTGRCAVPAGSTLEWDASTVRTEQPGSLRVSQVRTLPGEAVSYGPVRRLSRDEAARGSEAAPDHVGPGDHAAHLAYRAEGWCFYRIEGNVVGATCFHEEAESASTSWWVRTSCGDGGWLRVDAAGDRLTIDRRF